MQSRSFAFAVLGATLAAVAAGLLVVGGPTTARREKFDNRRYENLSAIARSLLCANSRVTDPALPQKLTVETLGRYCSGVLVVPGELIDSESGDPYAYTRKSDKEFSVCAVFHDARKVMAGLPATGQNFSFDPDSGCVSGRIR